MDEAIIKAMLVNAIKIGKFVARLKKNPTTKNTTTPVIWALYAGCSVYLLTLTRSYGWP